MNVLANLLSRDGCRSCLCFLCLNGFLSLHFCSTYCLDLLLRVGGQGVGPVSHGFLRFSLLVTLLQKLGVAPVLSKVVLQVPTCFLVFHLLIVRLHKSVWIDPTLLLDEKSIFDSRFDGLRWLEFAVDVVAQKCLPNGLHVFLDCKPLPCDIVVIHNRRSKLYVIF